jgi:hypothetical protein
MPRTAHNGLVPVKKDIVPMKIERPSFAQTFKEGLAFGAGSSIAQTIIRSIGRSDTVIETKPTESKPTEYNQCMTDHNDKAACAHLLQNA